MPAAPLPTNGTGTENEIEAARANLRKTLCKLKEKKTARLSEDSKLFRLRARLTSIATEGEADRRRGYLEEADAD